MVKFLVENGAQIFAETFSDNETGKDCLTRVPARILIEITKRVLRLDSKLLFISYYFIRFRFWICDNFRKINWNDNILAGEKCEELDEGYGMCSDYLYGTQVRSIFWKEIR